MEGNTLPLVSLIVLSYNQERYIAEAVNSALNQDYPNLEIILSDDCSTDSTFKIMQKIVADYHGNHTVILRRNEKNIGLMAHANLTDSIAKGEILTGNAGDDISLPNRVSEIVKVFMKHPEVMSLSNEVDLIDENGNVIPNTMENHVRKGGYAILSLTEYLNFKDFYLYPGASRARRRCVVEKFPPLSTAPDEDIYYFIRSLYLGSVAFLHQPLLLYRKQSESITAKRHNDNVQNPRSLKRLEMKKNSENQLFQDLKYAIENKYVDAEFEDLIMNKLSRLFDDYINVVRIPIPRWKRALVKPTKIIMKLLGVKVSVSAIV